MYHLTDKPSEIEIEIQDTDPEGVLTESVLALSEVFPAIRGGEPVTHAVALAADDLPGLLAAWMHELIRLSRTDGFVPERVEKLRLEGASLRAVVAGERAMPPRCPIESVHERRLQIGRHEDGGWAARVVLTGSRPPAPR